ncbi:MAG: alpha/beta hydrolase, partial [Hyphomicrobiaceae bacterium]|nr:alpha/beta hydrolase [Hyphomicrobiaceae bacterium]
RQKQKRVAALARRREQAARRQREQTRETQSGTRSATRTTRSASKPKSASRSPVRRPVKPVVAPPAIAPPTSEPSSASRSLSPGNAPETAAVKTDKQPENHTIVKVYYATDRQQQDTSKLGGFFGGKPSKSVILAGFFGGQPSEPKTISYGICEVAIPKSHQPGELETTSYWPSNWKEDPDKHVLLMEILPENKEAYFNKLKNTIQNSRGKNAFIFVHGYNVTFKDAARRTAQISYDLNFDGAPVFYSWPSTGKLQAYTKDEDNILWAQTNIKEFLKDFVEQTQAKNIYLIAHSMGSRALTGAVRSLVNEDKKFKKRFREIILAAPDINARVFRDNIAPKMVEASRHVTLYVSGDDKALLASRKFHDSARAGEAGENIIIVKDIDTVDATGVQGSNMLGHSYWAEAKSMINDILSVFGGTRAADRETLRSVKIDRGTYWTFHGTEIAP